MKMSVLVSKNNGAGGRFETRVVIVSHATLEIEDLFLFGTILARNHTK